MLKNDLVCITRQHCVAKGAKHLSEKIKQQIKLVFSPQNDQIASFGLCFFFECVSFWLLGFELETPTATVTRDPLC